MEFGRVVLSKSQSLRGRITGPEGQPVAGADVWYPWLKAPTGVQSARTDANGYYEISDLAAWQDDGMPLVDGSPTAEQLADAKARAIPGSNKLLLRVRHTDYGSKLAGFSRVPDTVNVTFVKPAVVTGQVVGQSNERPLAGIVVRLFVSHGPADAWSEASSDNQGRFRLLFQGAGTCTLVFRRVLDEGPSIDRQQQVEIVAGVPKDLGTIKVDLDAPGTSKANDSRGKTSAAEPADETPSSSGQSGSNKGPKTDQKPVTPDRPMAVPHAITPEEEIRRMAAAYITNRDSFRQLECTYELRCLPLPPGKEDDIFRDLAKPIATATGLLVRDGSTVRSEVSVSDKDLEQSFKDNRIVFPPRAVLLDNERGITYLNFRRF